MKIIVVLTIAGFLLTGCASTTVRGGKGGAVAQSVNGAAEFSSGEGQWQKLRSGRKVEAGANVQTGADSTVHFNLGDYGGVLTVHPESTLTFEQIGPTAPDDEVLAVLNLTRGRVTGDTLKLPGGKKIIVKTLGGVHEIR